MKATLPCAIYTRKSSDEGLEQDFNSLHAQREACEAFIQSQRHEGWKAVSTHYDDGGYSGGTLERPALKRLQNDLKRHRIKVVVVYKVDRLTRSLADFAKIVEQFDALGVSFVSVTQQFNTTSSMGHLTLNVLLSFAQFEREVTGERIRDKIAASKKNGLWMGGYPPLGYRPNGRTLVVEPCEAALVKAIFTTYLQEGNVRSLVAALAAQGINNPVRLTASGRTFGGGPFLRGPLYKLINNPLYLGRIRHRDLVHDGQHEAMIDPATWDAVQALLQSNRQSHARRRSAPSDSWLTGLIVDQHGHRLIPSHSQKRSKRYRYYLSEALVTQDRQAAPQGWRLPAAEIEQLVLEQLIGWPNDANNVVHAFDALPAELIEVVTRWASAWVQQLKNSPEERQTLIRSLLAGVAVTLSGIELTITPTGLLEGLVGTDLPNLAPIRWHVPATLNRCGMAMRLIVNGGRQARAIDKKQLALIRQGRVWRDLLIWGDVKNIGEIAKRHNVTVTFVTRTIYRACMATDIIRALINGTQPISLNSEVIKRAVPLPLDLREQRTLLAFPN